MNTIGNVIQSTIFDTHLFQDKITSKQGAVIRALEKYCVGYENRKQSIEFLNIANDLLSHGKIEDDYELRMIIKSLKDSETYLRIIGSTTSGIWLGCLDDEVDANQYMVSRTKSGIRTCLRNGVKPNVFYEYLNEVSREFYPQHNQTRHQFNTEKTIIKRYSDDKKEMN